MSQPPKKLDQLTITRFIAALSVVIFHGRQELYLLNIFPIQPLLTSGLTAVSYFYVLSGFVMALAYYRPEKRFDFRNYWVARFSRIYPVYLFSFVITCLYYLDIMSKVNSDKILANIFLYQAWIPSFSMSFNVAAWSLSVETFFYLIFPFVVIFAMRQPPKRLIWLSLGFWVVSQIVHSILAIRLFSYGFVPEVRFFLGYFPLFHLNSFLLGVAGGAWYVSESSKYSLKQSLNRILLVLALGLVSAALIIRDLMPTSFRTFSLDIGLLAPFFLIIILTLALDTTRLSKGLSHPWLVRLGDASYALYILHVPLRWILERYLISIHTTMTYGFMFSFYVPAVVIISILVFVYIERPARDWLRQNMRKIPLILLDLALIAGAVWASFALSFGKEAGSFARTETFALRVGLTVFFVALLIFRYYASASWRSLVLATVLGSLLLAGFMYLARLAEWVEGFPRAALLLAVTLIFVSIFVSRFLIRRWSPALLS